MISPRRATRPALLTEELGQIDVGTIRIVVPCNVTGVKRAGIISYRHAYIQQQFGWFHSGHHLLADQQIIIAALCYQPRSQAIMGSLTPLRSCKTDPADIVAISTALGGTADKKVKICTGQMAELASSAIR